jgi:WD40 repeat protein
MTVLGNQGEEMLAVAFSPDGKTLASGDLKGVVRLWDVASQKPRHDFQAKNGRWVSSLHFAGDSNALLVTEGDDLHRQHSVEGGPVSTRLWDVAGAKALLVGTWPDMNHALFSPDGKSVALAGREGGAVWDLDADSRVTRFPSSWPKTSPLAFAPDSKTLLVGRSYYGDSLSTLRLLDVDTGEIRGKYESPFGEPVALRLTATGRVVAVAVDGKEVVLVQTLLGHRAVELEAHTRSVNRMMFSSDGATMVTADEGGRLRVWSAADLLLDSKPAVEK